MSLGTGNWFGPTGDCNCCGDRDPLGPCCGGAYADCVPEGYINFSSMRAVVDIGNTFTFSERFHLGACSGPCIGEDRVQTWEYSLSGLAAANGTYIAKYVTYNPSTFEWEEIDTDRRNVCGVWFFPWVSVPVVETMVYNSVWSGCFSNATTTTTGPASAWFAPYLGQFFTSKTTPDPAFMNLFLGHQTNTSHPIVLRCDPGEVERDWVPYTCDSKTAYNVTKYWHIEQTVRPVACTALPYFATTGGNSMQSMLFGNDFFGGTVSRIAGPVGIGGSLTNITVDGVEGLAIPTTGTVFLTNGTACDLYYESVENNIKAYSHTDSRNASCHPTVPDPLVNTINWSAIGRKHSILLNV